MFCSLLVLRVEDVNAGYISGRKIKRFGSKNQWSQTAGCTCHQDILLDSPALSKFCLDCVKAMALCITLPCLAQFHIAAASFCTKLDPDLSVVEWLSSINSLQKIQN